MSNSLDNYRLFLFSEAGSQITHMMGISGNEALIAREKIFTENGVINVPYLSGNAIRHRAIREPGAKYLINRYDLAGKLTPDILNFLLTGGSLTEGSVTDNLKTIADMQYLFPLYRALGGSLKNQILSGSINVGRGVLLCEENRAMINKTLPKDFDQIDTVLMGAESFVSQYQYTRADATKQKDADKFLDKQILDNNESNLMIYNGQSIVTNSVFLHDIVLNNVCILEVGAVYDALIRWQEAAGTIGGQSRIGHGRLKTSVNINPYVDLDDARQQYLNHVDTVKDDAIAWLYNTFQSKPEPTGKSKK
ncbi:hypothetical protein [Leptospira noguchii]|uniref:Uncharacterized protein n=1 Tax=Leptospira noguchii TaxID=28182 RepID=M6VAN1_9LEPT|nr:hypothetical protein [Leptospira noguchii]EMO53940.1 hypothetical protein LEP1GSC172_3312 [Leptospira noguchii]